MRFLLTRPGGARPLLARLVAGAAIALGALLPSGALAHDDVTPPVPREQPRGEWPHGPHDHDVIIPVQLEVLPDGTVGKVTIEAGISPEFDSAAIAAAKKFTFEPARRGDKPITARIRGIVRFAGQPNAGAGSPGFPPPHTHPHAQGASSSTKGSLAPPLATGGSQGASQPPRRQGAPPTADEPPAPVDISVEGQAPPRSASEVVRTAENIRTVARRTGSDALLVVPGVFLTQHSGEGKAHQIFLRGFDAVHGQDVELWVGGAPVNEVSNIHGQGYADLHFVMPETILSVRGQPGTFDPRQGDFAVAGSVRYELGLEEPGLVAKGTLGTFGVKRLFLAYRPPSFGPETFAAAEVYATDGFGPSRAASRASVVGQLEYDVGPVRARVMASAATGRFDSPGVLRLDDVQLRKVDRFATYDPKQGGQSSRTQLVIDLSNRDGQHRFSLAPFLVLRSLRLRNNFTGYLIDPLGGDSLQQVNEAVTVGARGHYRRTIPLFSESDSLEIGVYARNDWVEQSQRRLSLIDDSVTEDLVSEKVRATDAAAYIDAQIRPFRRLTLRGGLRADGLSYSTESLLSGQGQARSAMGFHLGGKATADVTLTSGLHAIAAFGQGFRSPQARSLGDGERAPFASVLSAEAGLRYKDRVFDAYAAGFYTTLDKDLVFDHVTGRNEAVPATRRGGVSADIVARPAPYLLTTVSVTYTHASFTQSQGRYEAGSLLPYVPQLVARTELALTPTLTTLWKRPLTAHLGFGTTFLHGRPLPYDEVGHDIFTADARVSARLKEVEVTLDLSNLTNARYFDGEFVFASGWDRGKAPSLLPIRHVTVGPPFGAFVSLSLHVF